MRPYQTRRRNCCPPAAAQQPIYRRPAFIIRLHYSGGGGATSSRKSRLSRSDLDAIVSSLPSSPEGSSLSSSGDGAVLFFRQWHHALAAVADLWRRRLAGGLPLPLNPRLSSSLPCPPPSDKAEEASLLSPVFVSHAKSLLQSDSVRRCEKRIEEVSNEIKKVVELLRKPNVLRRHGELVARKRRLCEEKEIMRSKLVEFRAGIGCILKRLGEDIGDEDEEEEEQGGVAVFDFLEEMDWCRICCLLERECRRLNEGLPIYARRRKILRHVRSNQVLVLIGETGSGKSTQLVQFLADSGLAVNGSIVCTQPRKIAVMSVAQRIKEESSGCYTDDSVICYPTYSSFQKLSSKMIFMTDHCLMQHCMHNMSLSGISVLVVDEAHERSLNTDLLLAVVKKQLLLRFDLRLIVMSATADANKLSDYFYGCCTFNVTGRNFPVEIKYAPDIPAAASITTNVKIKSGCCASYVSDVVRMVSIIHKTEEDGAILAFLTSPVEVEWACENFDDPSAIVLPMHGKLSCEDQNRAFQIYAGKRKIIFSTNVAETSITIRDVKYVVDSGMVKESRFEPSSGMNVLKVCWISQSSANQRAGRAGRTGPGKCYRLYSECDFQQLQTHQDPEIRKVHLGIAVLRVLGLGIQNIEEFEFIDAPSSKAIEKAVENLIYLDIIARRNDALEFTNTGRHVAKLGIEPRLGKIILDCFSCGLSKEGLVLAAVMANASNIFCRVGSDDEKYKADCFKVPFCHRDGDLFTLLSVYKAWEDYHENRNKWCWQNSINAKSMRRCHETVLELENCLKHELNVIIPSYWMWNPDTATAHDRSLKRVLLSSLAENLAMYTGSDRLGYEVALTGQNLQLHPSCSLHIYAQKPSWVVFGEILSVSSQYLICVTAVDYECLCEIQPPLFDISILESRKMQISVLTEIGSCLLRRLCGKLNQNLNCIVSRMRKACMDDRVNVDVDFDKREIQLFARARDMDTVSSIFNKALTWEKKCLRDECMEKCLFHGGPGSTPAVALFGSGAEIKHLEVEKKFLTVEISHPRAYDLDDDELLSTVEEYAPRIANFSKNTDSCTDKWGKVTFITPENAERAVEKLNLTELQGYMLKVLPVRMGNHLMLPFPAVKARISWPHRQSRGLALVTCAAGDAELVVKDCSQLEIGGRYVHCEVSTKYSNCVFVIGIPRDVYEPELHDAFFHATKRRILDIHLLRGEAINDVPAAQCKEALIKEITPFMPKANLSSDNFQVEVLKAERRDYMVKAVISFDGSLHLEAAKALDHIQGKVLPGCLAWQKIYCQHMFYSSLSCPARVYMVIKKQLDSLLESFKHEKGVMYEVGNTVNGLYRVKIRANATKIIADVRKPLEQLMKGNVISHPSLTPSLVQLLLSRNGLMLIKGIERDTKTYILYDRKSLNVKVFGPPEEVAVAEERLIQSMFSLHEDKQLEIRLHGHNLPPDLMKEVVRKFGPDLSGLKERVPGVELVLNTRRHILSIKGNKELKQNVEDAISEVVQSLDCGGGVAAKLSEETWCPICLCELEEPYKLEACGHDFCRACLIEQCESVLKSRDGFPLCCTKEGCKEPLLIVDLKSLLPADKLEDLFRASVGAFVETNSTGYRFCPTPDCPAVYRVAPPDAEIGPFVCGACSAETCTKCHLEYHPFVSCEKYKEYKEHPDQSLLEWRMGKQQVKDCPSCQHTIEKIDGCNHIECRCGKHICWVCLESFSSSDQCYSHLRSEHSSI